MSNTRKYATLIRGKSRCWICGCPMPSTEEIDECRDCDTGPWYMMHDESDSVWIEKDRYDYRMQLLSGCDEIGREAYEKLLEKGWTDVSDH